MLTEGLASGTARVVTAGGFLASVFLLLTAKPATGQVAITAEDCDGCSLRLGVEHLATLAGPEVEGEFSAVAIDRGGHFLTTQFSRPTEIIVFDHHGDVVGKIGGKGQGPGEFLHIGSFAIRDDSLFVIDPGNQRISVFSAEGAYERSVRLGLPSVRKMLFHSDTTLLVVASVPSPTRSGLPLHEVDTRSGAVLRSYGDLAAVVNPLRPWLNSRVIAAAGDGSVWTARRTAYELERWDESGQRTAVMQRNLSWFQPYVDRPIGEVGPPPPWLMAVTTELNKRYIVVAVTRPTEDYVELLGPKVPHASGGAYFDRNRRRLLYDTYLEVVDLEERRPVAAALMDDYVIGFVPGTMIGYTYDENERSGAPSSSMFRLRLIHHTPSGH